MGNIEENTELSSKDLFHYTCRENFISILKSKELRVKYSEENLLFVTKKDNPCEHIYIPYICFCDIPLELSSKHKGIYGSYAFGFSKNVIVNKYKINPVIYIVAETFLDTIFKSTKDYLKYNSEKKKLEETEMALINKANMDDKDMDDLTIINNSLSQYRILYKNFKDVLGFTKPYIGYFEKNEIPYDNYKFYDEREWRYIPNDKNLTKIIASYKDSEENTKNIIAGLNTSEKLMKNNIKFTANIISHLIVKNESEKEEILNIVIQNYAKPEAEDLCKKLTSFEKLEKTLQ